MARSIFNQKSTASKVSVPPPQTSKIKDWEEFEKFVEANYEQTQQQMAAEWGNCSRFTISRGLKNLVLLVKKTIWLSRKRRTRKRRIYL